jgi:hypothetical protein
MGILDFLFGKKKAPTPFPPPPPQIPPPHLLRRPGLLPDR